MDARLVRITGRGAAENPPNRFEHIEYVRDEDSEDEISIQTQLLKDSSRSIIAYNDSPDVGFDASINPYRGCEHGCIYCYARPTHEFLGLSSGLDFETKIFVKEEAPALLRKELASPKWRPQTLAISGVTDAYQPVERKLRLTRRCLEVLLECRNPAIIVTKNHLVTRDIDLLREMARHNTIGVFISVTSLDPQLARVMEPRASTPSMRLEAIRTLSEAEVPVGVMVAPVVPGLTDHEIISIVSEAAKAGARSANYVLLRLPYANKELFDSWLTRNFPDRRNKVLSHIRDTRGGNLNEYQFGERMRGKGPFAEQIAGMFRLACRKAGIANERLSLTTDHFKRPGEQLGLFE